MEEYIQSSCSKGERDLQSNITNQQKLVDGMSMYPFSKKKPVSEFYYISPKFDNSKRGKANCEK